MTKQEKIAMYSEKRAFVKGLSKVFETGVAGSSVESIDYEVYEKEIARDENIYRSVVEFVIVRFFGGGKSVKSVNGNSNTANFKVIGTIIDGGYYDENRRYDSMIEDGYELIQFSDNMKLDELLAKPMTHISDVHACFNYCKHSKDVERVLKMIPSMFGTFEVDYLDSDDEDTFVVINDYEENGDMQSETVEYEFWK